MKWVDDERPKEGDIRIKTGFLFFPITIGGVTRWLEKAAREQVLEVRFSMREWRNVKWLD